MNRLTDEKIEALSKSFYDKYAGKGLSPSEVMELHKSEYWDTVFQAEHSRLAAMAPEGALLEIIRAVLPYIQSCGFPPYDAEVRAKNLGSQIIKTVAPIFQARIEAERERVLKEVESTFDIYENELGFCQISNHIPYSSWQALKSSKQEAEK